MVNRDLAYFESIPWCATLLNDPKYVIMPTHCREPQAGGMHSLFAETLKTDRTISACLSLYKKPAASDARIEETKTLLAIGSGVNGYAHICHGGIVATVLDEAMGILDLAIKDREDEVIRAAGGLAERVATFTVELVVKYLKPVTTPQIVCATARISKIQGRKFWMKATIEDKSGIVLAMGEGIFVQKPWGKL